MFFATGIFKLNALFTFEFLVLILAVFLLAYVSRHQLNKWYRYVAGAIVVLMSAIIICTTVNLFLHCCGSQGKCVVKSCHYKCCDTKKDCKHHKKHKLKHKKWKDKKAQQESKQEKTKEETPVEE